MYTGKSVTITGEAGSVLIWTLALSLGVFLFVLEPA